MSRALAKSTVTIDAFSGTPSRTVHTKTVTSSKRFWFQGWQNANAAQNKWRTVTKVLFDTKTLRRVNRD